MSWSRLLSKFADRSRTARTMRMCFKALCVFIFLMTMSLYFTDVYFVYNPVVLYRFNRSDAGPNSHKWIVVTTISSPTDDVKFLARIPGWRVVVVGDSKTPSNWSFPNCTFLGIEDQMRLGFKSVRHLPTGSYSRKNVGYLYAIAMGARVIYETDDDNRPLDLLANFILEPTTSALMFAGSQLFNPYSHFGQPTLWPRGYPLDHIGSDHSHHYILKEWKTPSIQQGVVNGDPDMDAIFRLTRKKTTMRLNVSFDEGAPPALVPLGVYSPFNSQNTLFLYDAMWAMLIPTTTAFRVCDIWRGYWAQRLVWEIGSTLAFFPPNAYQKRNSHSYLDDAVDEKDLYFETNRLLSFLKKWQCPHHLTFFACVEDLSEGMADNHFWKSGDVLLTKAWIEDLKDIGYKEPERQLNIQSISNVTVVDYSAIIQKPPLQTNTMFLDNRWQHVQSILKLCNTDIKLPHGDVQIPHPSYPNILLIIVFNYPNYNALHILETIYNMHFPRRIYCGANITAFRKAATSLKTDLSFLEIDTIKGFYGYECLYQAMKLKFNVDGYFYVADDVLLNVWNLKSLPVNQIWASNIDSRQIMRLNKTQTWAWFNYPIGRQAYVASMREINKTNPLAFQSYSKMLAKNTGFSDGVLHQASDIVYIPSKLANEFMFYFKIFYKHKLFLEMAFPNFFEGVQDFKNIIFLNGSYIWNGRDRGMVSHNFRPTTHFIHPVKPLLMLKKGQGLSFYCDTFLPMTLAGFKG